MLNKVYLLLLRILGNRINVITGDSLVVDRLIWLRRHLPKTNNNESVLDVGCGSGAFTLESAIRGYQSTGLSWDEANQKKALDRSIALNLESKCQFPICDIRDLDKFDSPCQYDFVINFENIEHIINDKKLFQDIYNLLKPGGTLLLTTPNINYLPMSREDLGPFKAEENGGHVRRGYSEQMLYELCEISGFKIEKIDYCSGLFSQFVTRLYRLLLPLFGHYVSWAVIFPLRPIGIIFELLRIKPRPYSISLVAYKPRFLKGD